jgi:hypothetical protein
MKVIENKQVLPLDGHREGVYLINKCLGLKSHVLTIIQRADL